MPLGVLFVFITYYFYVLAGSVPEQSLCMFGWVGGIQDQGAVTINYYLAVFDINQWYQVRSCYIHCFPQ